MHTEFSVGRPEGKRPCGRSFLGWKDNIRGDIQKMAWKSMDWIYLAQDRNSWRAPLNAVMNIPVP